MAMQTLVEYAKGLGTSDSNRPVIEMFAASSDIFGALPFEGMSGPVYEYHRQSALPTSMAFRGINEASTTGAGRLTPGQEASFVMDHDIDVDRAIVDRYGEERRTRDESMAIAQAGRLWVDTFVSGDNTTEPREFNGLQARSALFSRTTANSASSGGAALSLAKLDTAINAVNKNGGKTFIIAPFDSIPLWIAAARTSTLSGFVLQTWDEVGTPKMSYGGMPFLWGYQKDDHTPVLQFNEVGSGGGSAVTASLYVVNFGEGKLRGLQLKPLQAKNLGLLEDGITYRTHLSWDVGLVDEHKYCFHRLTSWTNAAIVA
jgi:hypothetical protein